MSIGAELGQYILQTPNKKILKIQWVGGLNPLTLLWVRRWDHSLWVYYTCDAGRRLTNAARMQPGWSQCLVTTLRASNLSMPLFRLLPSRLSTSWSPLKILRTFVLQFQVEHCCSCFTYRTTLFSDFSTCCSVIQFENAYFPPVFFSTFSLA